MCDSLPGEELSSQLMDCYNPKVLGSKSAQAPHWSSTIHHVSTQLCPHMLDGLCDMNYV